MAVIALVIAILALIVAGLSALYTRRMSVTEAETAARDKARRHDELTPKFTAELKPMANSLPYRRLRLRLDTQYPLSAVTVRLLGAPVDVQFTSGQVGTESGASAPVHDAFAVPVDGIALRPHEDAVWQIELNSLPEDGLRVRIDAEADDDAWQVVMPVPTPPEHSVW